MTTSFAPRDNSPGYDVIGDVHGSGHKLEGLLERLGYTTSRGPTKLSTPYTHPARIAVFVGDLIDRGPSQLRVLKIVKAMVDYGSARIVMGNHELNALAYATPDPSRPGEFCRAHKPSNLHQHVAFLDQLSAAKRRYYLDWFLTLPLWLDLGDVRVVHACWHEPSRRLVEDTLGSNTFSSIDQLIFATSRHHKSDLYRAVEVLLKGPEMDLRDAGVPEFLDPDGHQRHDARVRWWVADSNRAVDLAEIPHDASTSSGSPYPSISPDLTLDRNTLPSLSGDTPVIYGHYWRRWDYSDEHRPYQPIEGVDWTKMSACVDFSAVRGGPLVAYRWNDGDTAISPDRFVAYH